MCTINYITLLTVLLFYLQLFNEWLKSRKAQWGKQRKRKHSHSVKPTTLSYAEGRRKAPTYATGRKLTKPNSVTNEDLVNQLIRVARQSPQLLQQLKTITQQRQSDNAGISQFVRFLRVNLPRVAFGNSRWKDKATGVLGVKSLLAEAIAKEEGSNQSAVLGPNTTSCETATTGATTKKRKSVTVSDQSSNQQFTRRSQESC